MERYSKGEKGREDEEEDVNIHKREDTGNSKRKQ
jgi:hypothetical protein